MPTTDTNVPQVIVNKLTKAEYETATKSPTEFYAVTDEEPVYVGSTLSTPSSVAYVATDNIQDNAVTAAKASFTTYSTSEQVVGTWTDGKPIYRRVLTSTTSSTAGADASVFVLSSYDVDTIVKIDGFVGYTSSSTSMMALNYNLDSSHYCTTYYYATNQSIYAKCGQASCPITVVVEYTKTTD